MAQVLTYNDRSLPGTQKTTGLVSATGQSRSSAYTNNGGAGVRATTPYSNGSYTKPNSTPVSYTEGQAYVRNPTLTTASSRGNLPSNRGGGGGTASTATGGGGGGGGGYAGGNGEDIISKIKALLEEQQAKADEYYKTMYEDQLRQNQEAFERDRNNANLNYYRTNRYLKNLYGDTGNITGQGLSNQARAASNWNNALANSRSQLTGNNATALANYNTNLANSKSQLAQGWYNYVLPYYSQDALNKLDYAYRSSLL